MKKSFKPGAMISPLPAVMVSCGEKRREKHYHDSLDRNRQLDTTHDLCIRQKVQTFP